MKNLFILILLSVGLYYAYEEGLLDDLLSDFQTGLALGSKSINELSCEEDVKNIAKNQELKNAFGLKNRQSIEYQYGHNPMSDMLQNLMKSDRYSVAKFKTSYNTQMRMY